MLKPLLFILVIVSLIALALNFNLFSDEVVVQAPIAKPIEKVVKIVPPTVSEKKNTSY